MNKPLFLALLVFGVLMGFGVLAFVPLASTNIYFLIFVPFACLFVLIMVFRTKWALILLLFARPLLNPVLAGTKVEVAGSQTGIGGVLNLLIISIAVLLILQNLGQLAGAFTFVRWWVFFLLVGFVSIAYAPDAGMALKSFSQLTTYPFIFLIPFFIIKNDQDKKFWIKALFFSTLLPVALTTLALPSKTFLHYYSASAGLRLQGTFAHSNVLAFYVVWALALSFLMLRTNCISMTKMQRMLVGFYMLNLAVVLLATKTRSAWVACWIFFAIYGLLKEKKILFLSLVLATLMLFTPQVRERISTAMSGKHTRAYTNADSWTWRVRLWNDSLPLIRDRIVAGQGLGAFQVLSPTFFRSAQSVVAHNVYIEILFETGILGLIGFLGTFLAILRRLYSKMRRTTEALSRECAIFFSYLVSYLVVCFSDNILMYIDYNWYFFFFLGLACKTLFFPGEPRRD